MTWFSKRWESDICVNLSVMISDLNEMSLSVLMAMSWPGFANVRIVYSRIIHVVMLVNLNF